ncbi:aspartyl/asparaginyl beta-hydroxylase domain-containing protein [uncultured Helicobacter sp.]
MHWRNSQSGAWRRYPLSRYSARAGRSCAKCPATTENLSDGAHR